jgi:SAM-dependent methyltransferase
MLADYHRPTHWDRVHALDASCSPGRGYRALTNSISAVAAAHRRTGGVVLDIGCGSGQLLVEVAGRTRGIGTDFSVRALRHAAELTSGHGWLCADARGLPLGGGTIDVATCISSLWTFAEPREVLAEAARVLRPGGALIVHLWARPSLCRLLSLGAAVIGAVVPESRIGEQDGQGGPVTGPFTLTPGNISGWLAGAGFGTVRWRQGSCLCPVASPDEYWAEFACLAATAYHFYRQAPARRRDAVDALLARMLAQHASQKGTSALGLSWWVGVASVVTAGGRSSRS